MTKLVTTAQMRALEQAAVEAGVSEQQLMEEAGLAAAQEAWMAVGAIEQRGILVLVGPGNNGGDGLVAARQMVQWGAIPYVYLLRSRPDDDPQWRALIEAEVPWTSVEEDPGFERLEALLQDASAIVDGLLGIGASPRERPIEGDLAEVLRRVNDTRSRIPPPQIIALDVPTGVDADSGYADPHALRADLTVTFGFPKVGLYSIPGREYAGRVVPVELSLPPGSGERLPYEELRLRDLKAAMPARPADANKGTFGTVTIAAGSRRYPGAARLAAEAAARSGAGLVELAAPEAIQLLLVHGLPDVIHEPLPSTDGALDGEAARALLRALRAGRSRALLVGPGLGLTDGTRAFVQHLLAGLDAVEGLAAVVFDADALNALAGDAEWWTRLSLPRVLTPHPGEMARLTGTTVAEVQADRLGAASRYAQLTSSVVVLKGACTVVAAPDGTARLSDAANAMLAHAGTGDVLAGLIGGLIAQGLAPADAAGVAVYLHADAGRRVAEAYGTAAGLAQDLLRALPESRKLFEAAASAGPAAGGPFGVGMPDLGGLGGMAGGMQSSGGLGGQDLDALLGSGPPRGF
jgi:NAD(P)H-hydrate epimerase